MPLTLLPPDPNQDNLLLPMIRRTLLALLESPWLHGDERARGRANANACRNVRQLQGFQVRLTACIKERQQDAAAIEAQRHGLSQLQKQAA